MSFNRVKGLLDDASDISMLDNIANDKLDKPYLVDAICRILDDNSTYIKVIKDQQVLKLFRLCKRYFETCFSCFLDQSVGGVRIDTLLPYVTTTIYRTDAPGGLRISTVNEVKNGIEQLVPEVTYNIPDEKVRYLNLLLWTMTGLVRYYGAAGLEYTYVDGRLDETELQLIYRAGTMLRDMIDWIADTADFERTIATLKLARKNRYSYPNYAGDEIKEDTSFKQAVFICRQRLFAKNLTDEQYRIKTIIFKIDKKQYKPLPHEMAIIRGLARRIQEGTETNLLSDELPQELKEICDRFDIAEQKGYISSNEFVFKILDSVKKYKKCSPKQMAIINEAEEKIAQRMRAEDKSKDMQERQEQTIKNTDEMLAMYDALGSGIFDSVNTHNKEYNQSDEDSDSSYDSNDGGQSLSGVIEI